MRADALKFIIVASGILVAALASNSNAAPALATGNDLLAVCATQRAMCVVHVNGISMGYQAGYWDHKEDVYCIREGVTPDQVTDVVLKAISENPKTRDVYSVLLVTSALRQAFPCRPIK